MTDEQKRRGLASQARRAFEHWHPTCSACALTGYGEHQGAFGLAPNYAGWERCYVESRRAIPVRYRPAFLASMGASGPYPDALRESVRLFGVPKFTH